jgi:hypothetical protein
MPQYAVFLFVFLGKYGMILSMIHRLGHHIKHHMVPTKRNGYIPRLLREKQILVLLGIGLALFSFSQYARLTGYFGLTAEVYPAVIVTLTNKDRVANNLPEVTMNSTLTQAAKLKAQDMATKGYFAHTSPDGHTPWYWFAQAGYGFLYAGENLAVNFEESDAVQSAWLDSPTHRANIMNKNFTEMGVATATGMYNGKKTTFVVEMFAMPAVTRSVPSTPSTAQQILKPVPAQNTAVVAGQSTQKIVMLEETPTYALAQNTDQALEPGNPTPVPTPKVSWLKRLVLSSDKIAGLVIQTIFVLAIIATMGMVARAYEKRHRMHMVYGTLVAVIMFSSLFVGKLGIFAPSSPVASAPLTVLR